MSIVGDWLKDIGEQWKTGAEHRRASKQVYRETLSDARDAMRGARSEVRKEIFDEMKETAAAAAKKNAAREAKTAMKAAGKPGAVYRFAQDGFLGTAKRSAKRVGIAGLIVAGVATLGIAAASMSKRRSKVPAADDLDAMDASLAASLPQQDAGPAEGRGVNEWQNRVRPGAQPGREPVNPAMSVGEAADLNPPGRA